MSTTNAATFACESCGKSYRWRPDFAGKKLKCGCGNVMQPTSPPTVADLPEAPLQAAPPRTTACPECSSPIAPGAAICINCGFNLQTGARVQTQVVAETPKTGKTKKKKSSAAKPAAKAPVLDSLGRRLLADDPEEVAARARWDDIYWPTAAVVVGLGLNFVDASGPRKSPIGNSPSPT